jgi:DNA-binding XRE family transcriptional regulator
MALTQIIRTESGEELVVMSRRDYVALLARAGDKAAEDEMTARIIDASRAAQASGEDVMLPAEVWAAIEADENPVKVLRKHRGLTQTALADAASVSQGYIADLEAGRKTGAPDTLKRIARALAVPLDVLVA